MLNSADFLKEFQRRVPVFDYKEFISVLAKLLEGKENITCRKIRYFGLTSNPMMPANACPFHVI
jgi:hypothetical protein